MAGLLEHIIAAGGDRAERVATARRFRRAVARALSLPDPSDDYLSIRRRLFAVRVSRMLLVLRMRETTRIDALDGRGSAGRVFAEGLPFV